MQNHTALTIDTSDTPAEPAVDHEAIEHDLHRHAVLSRQLGHMYVGGPVHEKIKASLARQGVKIR